MGKREENKVAARAILVGRRLREAGVVAFEHVLEICLGGPPDHLPPTTDEAERIAAIFALARRLPDEHRPKYPYSFDSMTPRSLALRLTMRRYSEEQTLAMMFAIKDALDEL